MAKIIKIIELFLNPLKRGVRNEFISNQIKFLFFVTALITSLSGQFTTDPGKEKSTIAILNFESRDVSPQEVQTLSERMRTEIGNTNAVRLIERKAVDKIMEEQGFQQMDFTMDENVSEVRQLLGV